MLDSVIFHIPGILRALTDEKERGNTEATKKKDKKGNYYYYYYYWDNGRHF
jgi:hypothetical protein